MNYIKNDHVIYVGKGFNFLAFVFSWGWLLAKGLWLYGFIFMIIQIPLYFYAIASSESLTLISENSMSISHAFLLVPNLVLLVIHLYIGYKGNVWRENLLQRKGYNLID